MSAVNASLEAYLEKALRARIKAAQAADPETKDELLRLAAAFDLLAEHKKLGGR